MAIGMCFFGMGMYLETFSVSKMQLLRFLDSYWKLLLQKQEVSAVLYVYETLKLECTNMY